MVSRSGSWALAQTNQSKFSQHLLGDFYCKDYGIYIYIYIYSGLYIGDEPHMVSLTYCYDTTHSLRVLHLGFAEQEETNYVSVHVTPSRLGTRAKQYFNRPLGNGRADAFGMRATTQLKLLTEI